nr:sigma-70 family RNA polymerase sigma factor [Sphingobacterium humi]
MDKRGKLIDSILFQDGNSITFDRLFKELYAPLCMFAMQFKVELEEAEELVQDVFVQLWKKELSFDNFSKLSSFLYVATRNATFNLLEKNKRLNQNQKDYHSNLQHHNQRLSPEQLEKLLYVETLNRVHQILQQLPAQCKRIMELTYIEGYSVQEISELLQVSSNSIYVQKKKGLDYLKTVASKENLFYISLFLAGCFKH